MDTLAHFAPALGIVVLLVGVVAAVYGLMFTRLELKRVVTLAGLLFFCGVFLILFERISQLELPGALGKITLEAKQDARQIRTIREEMEVQQQAVTELVSDVQTTSTRVSLLAAELDDKVAILRSERKEDRIRYLEERIRSLEKDIPQWEKEKHEALNSSEPQLGFTLEQRISDAWTKLADYSRELKELRKTGGVDAPQRNSD